MISVDLFAGGGGASTGIARALGADPRVAINHNEHAIAMHQANHPDSQHFLCDINEVDPRAACAGHEVALLWASPDCRHFSRAKGGAPVSDSVRTLPWVIPRWLAAVRPRVMIMENVEPFRTWGPLIDSRPDKTRKGETFRRWLKRIEALGYVVEHRELKACDYGAPTSRKRLFVIARCDGEPIVWPTPTHGPGRPRPWRTAAECIDWTIPCPSIFERKEPLEEATLRRIARGIRKYVIESARPFIVPVTHQGGDYVHDVDEPMRTITGANRGELALLSPTLVQTSWGERVGQAPRCMDPQAPIGTLVGGGIKHAIAVAHLVANYGGNYKGAGSSPQLPLRPITARDHNSLVTSNLVVLRNNCDAQSVETPSPTACASAQHIAEARAFLCRYNGTATGQAADLPLSTVDTHDRFALVVVEGVEYVITDIGFRMLTPAELFRAQGFPADYKIAPMVKGRPMSKTAQIKCVGNSVCPPLAEALVRANVAGVAAPAQAEAA